MSLALSASVCAQEKKPPESPAAEQVEKPEQTSATEAALPLDELRTFADVFNQIRQGYVEEVDDRTLLRYAIQGMLQGLDPHSVYLEAEDFKDLQVSTSGEFSGLGVEIGTEDGFIKVIAPIDDTPASKAGIESGDIILKLDNRPAQGLTLNEAVEMMRGPKGSSIDLTISRRGQSQPFTVTLVRDIIRTVSVRHRWLEPGYAYLRIAQFQARTGRDVAKAIGALKAEGELKGIVLDLRNNPGGILQGSVDVAGHFLDGGQVVYTEGRLDKSQTSYEASSGDLSGGAPVVVLINGGSASASEIVSGALQDHRRAVIMGTPSFGKGSVQTIMPLSDARAIKLTTALYFTPKGRSIQAQGIAPDIEVERARVTALEDVSQRVSEADLSRRLGNASGTTKRSDSSTDLLIRDNQLYEALTLLKGIHIMGMYDN